ncbi:unnamed protein product [marine sediment metagenome]|uniref:Uncharacterized protein n=1 Tax=marine sediment metagenome TaxID=412755 RepID=X0TH01_9ZZZZ
MKYNITQWVLLLVLALTIWAFWLTQVECAWCPTYTCYGAGCPSGCFCLIPPGEVSGNCYSVVP